MESFQGLLFGMKEMQVPFLGKGFISSTKRRKRNIHWNLMENFPAKGAREGQTN